MRGLAGCKKWLKLFGSRAVKCNCHKGLQRHGNHGIPWNLDVGIDSSPTSENTLVERVDQHPQQQVPRLTTRVLVVIIIACLSFRLLFCVHRLRISHVAATKAWSTDSAVV